MPATYRTENMTVHASVIGPWLHQSEIVGKALTFNVCTGAIYMAHMAGKFSKSDISSKGGAPGR